MPTNEYLFPNRLSRRDFIQTTALAASILAVPGAVLAADRKEPVRIGSGKHMYEWVEDWGKLLDDTAAVTAMLDRLLHHGHVLKCGPRSWRTKTHLPEPATQE